MASQIELGDGETEEGLEEIQHLENLSAVYEEKARETGHWADYLKAHGLMNAHVARSYNESVQERIYELEADWYGGAHPLLYPEFQVLNHRHRELLDNFRSETKVNVQRLISKQEDLSVDDMFEETNLKQALELSDNVFEMSKNCSEEFVKFTRCVLESSVDILLKSGNTAPCPFAVIGLGSAARGEVTPYSDLEYAFIIESHDDDEYFTRLAVDSYFRIGNLSETPLKCFNISELRKGRSQPLPNESKVVVGYRIDGISESAGNIPTGSPGGQSLILTIEELVKLYKDSAFSPLNDIPGDMSDLLSTSVLVYANNGGQELYDVVVQRLAEEANNIRYNPTIVEKRLRTLQLDLSKYEFLPEFKSFGPPENSNVKVKSDIFRYPTLLVGHLKIFWVLNSHFPWEVLSELNKCGLISEENCNWLKIVLAFSILIRTSAYLALGTQSEQLSLYTSSVKEAYRVYHVPRNLFITLGCLLIVIKLSVRSIAEKALANTLNSEIASNMMSCLLSGFQIDKSNVVSKIEVLYFAGDFDGALSILYDAFGKEKVDNMSSEVLETIQLQDCQTRITPIKCMEIISFLLICARKYSSAGLYLRSLIVADPSELRWKILSADCYNKTHSYQEAAALLNEVICCIRSALQLKSDESLPCRLLEMPLTATPTSSTQLALLEYTAHSYKTIAETCQAVKFFAEAEEILQVSIKLFQLLDTHQTDAPRMDTDLSAYLGGLYLEQRQYEKSLDHYRNTSESLKSVHGDHTDQVELAIVYSEIGRVHKEMATYSKSLEYYNQSLAMFKVIHSRDSNHLDIAKCLGEIGTLYSTMGDHARSLEYLQSSLDLYEKSSNLFDKAECHRRMANVYSDLGDTSTSLKTHLKALDVMMKHFVRCKAGNHPDLANIYNDMGTVYSKVGDFESSVTYHIKSLNMIKAVYTENYNELMDTLNMYLDMEECSKRLNATTMTLNLIRFHHGQDAIHPDIAAGYSSIGLLYHEMSQYHKSLENYKISVSMYQAIYGKHTANPDLALAYSRIEAVYGEMCDYPKALEYHNSSLGMLKLIYGENAFHPFIARAYFDKARMFEKLAEYNSSLEFYKKSLEMMKTIYGSNALHCNIADSYGGIGIIYMRIGEYTKGLDYCNKSLDMLKVIFGETAKHFTMTNAYTNLGMAYANLGDPSKALSYHIRSLQMTKELYGRNTKQSSIAICYYNVAATLREMGNYKQSLTNYKHALRISKSVYGKEAHHTDTAAAYRGIGEIYLDKAEYDKSLKYFFKALNIMETIYGKDTAHPEIASCYDDIGLAYQKLGNLTESLDYFGRSLEMEKAVYGEKNKQINIPKTYLNIGILYGEMGEYSKSNENCLKASDILHSLPPSEGIATCYTVLGKLYCKMGEHSLSLDNHNQALIVWQTLYGEQTSHVNIADSYCCIGQVHRELGNHRRSREYLKMASDMKKTLGQVTL